jgi:hypothetical protein
MHQQTHKEHHEKNEEANLRNSSGSEGHKPKSQSSSNQRNQQENQRVIQHCFLLCCRTAPGQPACNKNTANGSPVDAAR